MEKLGITEDSRLLIALTDETGNISTQTFDVPVSTTKDQLSDIVYSVIEAQKTASKNKSEQELEDDIRVPYSFYVEDKEIVHSLKGAIDWDSVNIEKAIEVVYHAQSVFKVRAVARCTSTLQGHGQPVLHVAFSPTGSCLASGSGDTTVRLWDLSTETPKHTCAAHSDWVLALAWSPNGRRVASGCKRGDVVIWNGSTGKQMGKTLKGHKQWITCIAWEPLHLNEECNRLVSSSKDGDSRIWNSQTMQCEFVLAGHLQSVTCVKWSGDGAIYSSSQDRTIKVWQPSSGQLMKTLQAHGHWVNSLALNSDYVMRIGAFDPKNSSIIPVNFESTSDDFLRTTALAKYNEFRSLHPERLVSGSDDFTLFLWDPLQSNKPINRMCGHQALINDVKFSPDGRLLASASFDKSIKVWNGKDGKFLHSLRGHVASVYQISWSADSRLLVSASEDSTIKLWRSGKLLLDLPGHLDQVYAVDWSPDGQCVATGSKDKTLKLWRP